MLSIVQFVLGTKRLYLWSLLQFLVEFMQSIVRMTIKRHLSPVGEMKYQCHVSPTRIFTVIRDRRIIEVVEHQKGREENLQNQVCLHHFCSMQKWTIVRLQKESYLKSHWPFITKRSSRFMVFTRSKLWLNYTVGFKKNNLAYPDVGTAVGIAPLCILVCPVALVHHSSPNLDLEYSEIKWMNNMQIFVISQYKPL